jgi:hypothetical protein
MYCVYHRAVGDCSMQLTLTCEYASTAGLPHTLHTVQETEAQVVAV